MRRSSTPRARGRRTTRSRHPRAWTTPSTRPSPRRTSILRTTGKPVSGLIDPGCFLSCSGTALARNWYMNRETTADRFVFRIGHNCPSSGTETEFKSKRRSQISTSSSSVPADGSTHGSTPTPPPLPERTDSLNNRSEEAELRKAPWFQAGIPRLVLARHYRAVTVTEWRVHTYVLLQPRAKIACCRWLIFKYSYRATAIFEFQSAQRNEINTRICTCDAVVWFLFFRRKKV